MPTMFDKNITFNAAATDVAQAASAYVLKCVRTCGPGTRCEACHQPITRGALIRSDRTERQLTIGLDCLERLEYIQRTGQQPPRQALAEDRKARKSWGGNRRRKPLVTSAVSILRQRREAMPEDLQVALDYLEVAGHPRTIEEGERLLDYYRQADPLWLLRIVKSRLRGRENHWRNKLGTVITFKVIGAENFRQVRQSADRELLSLSVSGGIVHEWTYLQAEGSITLKRYTYRWYRDFGSFWQQIPKLRGRQPSRRPPPPSPAPAEPARQETAATSPLDRHFLAAQFEAAGYRVTLC